MILIYQILLRNNFNGLQQSGAPAATQIEIIRRMRSDTKEPQRKRYQSGVKTTAIQAIAAVR